jgi:hypothetical protein
MKNMIQQHDKQATVQEIASNFVNKGCFLTTAQTTYSGRHWLNRAPQIINLILNGLKLFDIYCRYQLLDYESNRGPESTNSEMFEHIICHVIVSVFLILMYAHAHFIK